MSLTVRKTYLAAVDNERTNHRFIACLGSRRQVRRIDGEIPSHARVLHLEVTCYAARCFQMEPGTIDFSKQPNQQVKQMHANIHGQATGFLVVRLPRSEEHTSELQSPCNIGCRLLLEKKK